MGDPYPKEKQLARGERRYRRKVAGGKRWQALWDEKRGPCRICGDVVSSLMELHHLVFRSHFGDDTADNLVPLCHGCHCAITLRRWRRRRSGSCSPSPMPNTRT